MIYDDKIMIYKIKDDHLKHLLLILRSPSWNMVYQYEKSLLLTNPIPLSLVDYFYLQYFHKSKIKSKQIKRLLHQASFMKPWVFMVWLLSIGSFTHHLEHSRKWSKSSSVLIFRGLMRWSGMKIWNPFKSKSLTSIF